MTRENKTAGFAILGSIHLEKLGSLSGHFGIPTLPKPRASKPALPRNSSLPHSGPRLLLASRPNYM